jgi:hypothetical protein
VTSVYGHYTVQGTSRVLLLHSRFLQVHAAVAGCEHGSEPRRVAPNASKEHGSRRRVCHARNRSICSCGNRSTYIRQAAGDLAWRSKRMLKFHAVLKFSSFPANVTDRSIDVPDIARGNERESVASRRIHAVGYLALDTSSSV